MLDTNLALPPSMTAQRSAVVDLGSNSVRLVVFEGRGRNPIAIFNEKAVLRLGRGLQTSGLLNAPRHGANRPLPRAAERKRQMQHESRVSRH